MFSAVIYKSNWWGFISKRVLITVVAFFILTLAIFYALHYTERNYWFLAPLQVSAAEMSAYEEQIESELHMGSPFAVKYALWMKSLLTGDLGNSFFHFE
jgi:ABC-type dipeptide/oligopeptide/nickel transport system permease component